MNTNVGESYDRSFFVRHPFSSRAVLFLLSGLSSAAKARAQDPPSVVPLFSNPGPASVRPTAAAGQSIDKSKAYFLFFDQVIDVTSMRNLRKQLTNLVEARVSEMTLVINSGGGEVEPIHIT